MGQLNLQRQTGRNYCPLPLSNIPVVLHHNAPSGQFPVVYKESDRILFRQCPHMFVISGHVHIDETNRIAVFDQAFERHRSRTRPEGNRPYHCSELEAGPHTVIAVVATGDRGVSHTGDTFLVSRIELEEDATHELDLMLD